MAFSASSVDRVAERQLPCRRRRLGLPLVFLTTLLSTLSIYYSAGVINTRQNNFAMFHLLELGMIGVFMALVTRSTCSGNSLVPMYMLIGIWGGANRSYASISSSSIRWSGQWRVAGDLVDLRRHRNIRHRGNGCGANLSGTCRRIASCCSRAWPSGFFLGFAFKVPSFPFHLAAARPHRGADGRKRDPGGHAPEARESMAAHRPAYLSGGEPLLIMWLVALGAIAIVYDVRLCGQTDLKRLIA